MHPSRLNWWPAYQPLCSTQYNTNLCSLSSPVNAENRVRNMDESLSVLSVELVPVHQRLVSMRRQLVALAAKDHPSKTELKSLMEDLRKIDSLV